MPDPDNESLSIPLGFSFLAISMVLFQFGNAETRIWYIIPVLGLICVTIINLITQYTEYGDTNFKNAVLGAIPAVITLFLAIGISSITTCRIPIASIFSPFFSQQKHDKDCCPKSISLDCTEKKAPVIKGFSYGFYIMFGLWFGIAFGKGYASTP